MSPLLVVSGIEGIDVVAADVSDDASLEAMCSKASVLISCVGPVSINGLGGGGGGGGDRHISSLIKFNIQWNL